jgi:hypothetical protein
MSSLLETKLDKPTPTEPLISRSAVTCSNPIKDGIGAQMLRVISCIALAQLRELDYLHTPLSHIAHNDNKDSEYSAKWESFFNLKSLSTNRTIDSYTHIVPPKRKKKRLGHVIDLKKTNESTLYILHDALAYFQHHPNDYLPILEKISEAYNETIKPKRSFQKNVNPHPHLHPHPLSSVTSTTTATIGTTTATIGTTARPSKTMVSIAVHIRRGDIVRKNSKNGTITRLISNDHFINILSVLLNESIFDEFIFDVHIYSQGHISVFREFLPLEKKNKMYISLHINDDVFSTFHHLVSANLLIMSKSDFSYVAGLLSSGIKLFCPLPFWHQPLPGWLMCNGMEEDGTKPFNVNDMLRMLRKTHPAILSCEK